MSCSCCSGCRFRFHALVPTYCGVTGTYLPGAQTGNVDFTEHCHLGFQIACTDPGTTAADWTIVYTISIDGVLTCSDSGLAATSFTASPLEIVWDIGACGCECGGTPQLVMTG